MYSETLDISVMVNGNS